MRGIREDGTPYPRKRPVNFAVVRRILRHRQAHRDILAEGFVEIGHFGPWQYSQRGEVMTDCRVHPDGTRLYVKLDRPEPTIPFEEPVYPLDPRSSYARGRSWTLS